MFYESFGKAEADVWEGKCNFENVEWGTRGKGIHVIVGRRNGLFVPWELLSVLAGLMLVKSRV